MMMLMLGIRHLFLWGMIFYICTQLDELDEVCDPSSPLAGAPSIEVAIVINALQGTLTIHASSLPSTPLGKPENGNRFEIATISK